MPQAHAPDVGTLLKVRPVTTRAMPGFELVTQRSRIVVHHQLQTAFRIKMIEQLPDDPVAMPGVDIPDVDHSLKAFRSFLHHAL